MTAISMNVILKCKTLSSAIAMKLFQVGPNLDLLLTVVFVSE